MADVVGVPADDAAPVEPWMMFRAVEEFADEDSVAPVVPVVPAVPVVPVADAVDAEGEEEEAPRGRLCAEAMLPIASTSAAVANPMMRIRGQIPWWSRIPAMARATMP